MKRWMVTLGAMLLMPTLAAASGEMVSVSELREQVETMGRWQKTYQARGRTVEVDIPIIVPEVDEMPVMAAEPWRPFDEESWAPWQHITEIEERGGGEVITYYRCGDAGLYSFLNPNSEQERMTRIYMSKYPMDDAEFTPDESILATYDDYKPSKEGKRVVKIGVVGGNNDQFKVVQKNLDDAGSDLYIELVEFDLYNLPNEALHSGDIDMHACVTQTYFESDAAAQGFDDLSLLGYTIIAPLSLYSHKVGSVQELKDLAAK